MNAGNPGNILHDGSEYNYTSYTQTGKTSAIRRAAVREAGVSRHHGGTIEGLPQNPHTITLLSYRGYCLETPVSQKAIRPIAVVFPVFKLNNYL